MGPKKIAPLVPSPMARLNTARLNRLLSGLPSTSIVRKVIEYLHQNGIKLTADDVELLKRLDLANIDLSGPRSQYHLDIIRALFQKPENDGLPHRRDTLLLDVADQLEVDVGRVRGIKVEVFRLEDISLDIGTRRDVDLVTLETDKGDLTFTVSLDKDPHQVAGESHSRQEANTLMSSNTSQGRWATQRCYGYVTVRIGGRPRGVIVKEFLPGVMLGTYTGYIGRPEEAVISESLRVLAFAHGRMIGNIIQTSGGFPVDMTPENVIVNEQDGVTCRTCDLSGIDRNGANWLKSLGIDLKMWEKYGWHYLFGVISELSEVKADSFLALIQGQVGAPMIESLKAAQHEVAAIERRGGLTGELYNELIRRILTEH